jgi:oligosaccharide repeat unit polymerase
MSRTFLMRANNLVSETLAPGQSLNRAVIRSVKWRLQMTTILLLTISAISSLLALGNISRDLALEYLYIASGIIIGAVVLAFLPARKTFTTYAALVLNAALVFWYYVPALYGGVTGGMQSDFFEINGPDLGRAFAVVTFAHALMNCSYLVLGNLRRAPRFLLKISSSNPTPAPVVLIGALACIGMIPFLLSGTSLMTAILSGRSGGGPTGDYIASHESLSIYLLTYFAWAASLLGIDHFLYSRRNAWSYLALAIGVAMLVMMSLAQGTRTLLLVPVVPAMTVWYLRSIKRTSVRRPFLALIGILALLQASELLVRQRSTGFSELNSSETEKEFRLFKDADFFYELVFAMRIVPDELAFSYESPMLSMVTGLVPRALWPGRPEPKNPTFLMRTRMQDPTGQNAGNILPGILGQYWSVGGWFGISAIGIWLGLFAHVLDIRLGDRVNRPSYMLMSTCWVGFVSCRNLALSNFLALAIAAVVLNRSWPFQRPSRLIDSASTRDRYSVSGFGQGAYR